MPPPLRSLAKGRYHRLGHMTNVKSTHISDMVALSIPHRNPLILPPLDEAEVRRAVERERDEALQRVRVPNDPLAILPISQ